MALDRKNGLRREDNNGCGRINGGLSILPISPLILVRFGSLFFKESSFKVLQNDTIFINVNNFHHFETCDTIDWFN